jgi:hypothetical protein
VRDGEGLGGAWRSAAERGSKAQLTETLSSTTRGLWSVGIERCHTPVDGRDGTVV